MGTPDAERLLAIYLDDHRAGAAGGSALARRLADRYAEEPGYEALRELAREVDEDVAALDRLREELDVSGGDIKRLAALAGERLGRLKLNGRLTSRSPLSRVEELEQMAVGVFAKRRLWTAIDAIDAIDDSGTAPDGIDLDRLIERADRQLEVLADLHARAVRSAFRERTDGDAGETDTRTGVSS